ncbi:MAG: two-component regulator propeller domain-containing protein [Bacteroidota bacterium]
MNRRLYLTYIFLLVLSFNSFGQGTTSLQDSYRIRVWNTDDGLPSNNLRSLFQDSKGYFWIPTFNGLVRFDGHSFDIYTSDDLPGLETNGFGVVAEDKDGYLYFGTLTSGLFQYDGAKFTQLKSKDQFSNSITALFVDSDDKVWIGTYGNGLFIYNKETNMQSRLDDDLINNASVNCIRKLQNGTYWIATEEKGIIVYNNKEFSPLSTNLGDSIKTNCIIENNNIPFAGTNNGVYYLEDEKWSLVEGTKGFNVNHLAHDNLGNLFIATETGLIRISNSGEREFLDESNGIPSRQISSIVIDNEGNIWISTKRNGFALFSRSQFFNVSSEKGLSSNFINTVYQLSDGRVIAGNDNGGVDILKEKKVSHYPLKTNLKDVSIKDIIQDSRGIIWVATYTGVLKIEDGEETLFSTATGLPSDNTRCLFEDKDGNIWIGAKDKGLVRMHQDNTFKVFSTENGLSDNYVFCIEQLPDGEIIAGTYKGGLVILSNDDSIRSIAIGDDLTSPLIFNIDIVSQNEYWLATNEGLVFYNDGKSYLISKNDGLYAETIFDIYADNHGYLWLTSNIGLIRLNKQSVFDYIDRKIEKVNARLYDEEDGMMSKECTGATKMIVAKSGNIWVPTTKGLSIVNESGVIVNEMVPPVYIKAVYIDDEPVSLGGEIIVNPENRKLKVNYTAIGYASPDKINVKHRLVGYDDKWIEVGNQFDVTYMNLPPNEYTFEMMAANSDGFWNEKPATIKIVVKPYFYETVPFYVLLTSVVAALAFLIYWIRIRVVERKNLELRKLNEELDSFVYSVSHDLRAPLSSVLGLLNVYKIDEDNKNRQDYLDKIEYSVHKLDDFIKEIIDHSRNVRMDINVEEIDLLELTKEVLEGLSYMNSENNIDVSINSNGVLTLNSDRTRLKIIFNNIISNAFKYSKPYITNSYIKIVFESVDQNVIIRISDNGIGIHPGRIEKVFNMFYRASEEHSGSGLGLYIANESVQKIKGSIAVESDYDNGTIFTITIPDLKG